MTASWLDVSMMCQMINHVSERSTAGMAID